MWSIKGEHKFTDRWSLTGLLRLQQDDRAGHRIDAGDARLHGRRLRPSAAAAAPAGVQQHEHPERHDDPVAALRLDDVAGPDRQGAVHGRPRVARVQPELRQRDPSGRPRPVSGPQLRRGPGCRPLGRVAAPVDGTVFDQRRALEAVGQSHVQSGRRPPPAGDRDDDLQRERRGLLVHPRLHEPGGRDEQRPRAGEPATGPAHDGASRFRPRRVRVVREVLGRLLPGRLARRLELHAELRRAARARGRPPRDREPADRRVRPERRSVRSTRWSTRPGRRCRAARSGAA